MSEKIGIDARMHCSTPVYGESVKFFARCISCAEHRNEISAQSVPGSEIACNETAGVADRSIIMNKVGVVTKAF